MIYVRNKIKHKVRLEFCEAIDDVYESISVELKIDNSKNNIITCLYKAPRTNLGLFNEHFGVLLDKVNLNKLLFGRRLKHLLAKQ